MMTNHELTRVRRQMQQRIRVILAQRRVDAAHYPPARLPEEPEPVDRPSTKPPVEH